MMIQGSSEETHLKLLIERHLQKIFGLVIHLVWGNSNGAYDITVSGFVEALCLTLPFEKDEVFLAKLAGIAIEKCRNTKAIPSSEESDFIDLPCHKKAALLITKEVFYNLPFDDKALLLLRDQLHFAYRDIANIFNSSESEVKIRITHIRIKLRDGIKEILDHAQ
jgi:DNA-directed RNA polymerase specialized sigma24 family protein